MLDPTATTRQIMPVSVSRETEVNSVLEMLRSRIMIEKLVDELGPEGILRATISATTSNSKLTDLKNNSVSPSWHNLDPVGEREKAIDRVGKCLDAAIEKKSDVIT